MSLLQIVSERLAELNEEIKLYDNKIANTGNRSLYVFYNKKLAMLVKTRNLNQLIYLELKGLQ